MRERGGGVDDKRVRDVWGRMSGWGEEGGRVDLHL